MSYHKQICYLADMMGEERLGSAGYAQLETREDSYRLRGDAVVRGIPEGTRLRVWLRRAEVEVGTTGGTAGDAGRKEEAFTEVTVSGGRAKWEEKGTVVPEELRISLPGGREIRGEFQKSRQELKNVTHYQTTVRSAENKETSEDWVDIRTVTESGSRTNVMQAAEPDPERKEIDIEEISEPQLREAAQETILPEDIDETPAAPRMKDTKWEQLCALYPHVHPFHDEREYLSIGPEDFIVLRERCYQMTHNSFLLHGYYNYRHLLLLQQERSREMCYYLGVPGNFYEREKQVARMFGFESFECEREPAREGDFGYYLIRVEL